MTTIFKFLVVKHSTLQMLSLLSASVWKLIIEGVRKAYNIGAESGVIAHNFWRWGTYDYCKSILTNQNWEGYIISPNLLIKY